MQVLAKSLVISEYERFFFPNRSAKRSAKLIALKWRRTALVKKIRCIERAVAQKLEHSSVELVGARLRDNQDLAAGPFAEFRAVRIALHVELAHRVHAQQHPARTAGL